MNYQELDDRCKNLQIAEVGLELLGDSVKKRPISPDYLGLCPFHRETNPSFFLKAKWNRYVCFGCEKGGNPLSLPFDYFGDDDKAMTYLATKLKFDVGNKFSIAVLLNNLTFGEDIDRLFSFWWCGLEDFLRPECSILGANESSDLFRLMSQFALNNPEADNDIADDFLSAYLRGDLK